MFYKTLTLILALNLLYYESAISMPVHSWYLDEVVTPSSSSILTDNIGSNNGFTNNASSAIGKICNALDLTANSITDYANFGSALNGFTDFTVSIWHQGSVSPSAGAILSGAGSSGSNEMLMWFPSTTTFTAFIEGSNNSITIPLISDSAWHHLVWSRSGASNCFYFDGALEGCVNLPTGALDISSLILGQEQDSVGGGFDVSQDIQGLLDELLVFNTALSAPEILSIYTNQNAGNAWDGSTRSCSPPMPVTPGYSEWRFDELTLSGASGDVIDSNGSNHGTSNMVSPTAGKICNAIDLSPNSITDYVTLNTAAMNGLSDFTISIWHKGNSPFAKGLLSGANASTDNELLMFFPSNTGTQFQPFLKGSSGSIITVPFIADNSWHHLVWRRLLNQNCFFFDGVNQGCILSLPTSILNITSLILGQEQDSVGGGFSIGQDWEGIVDELIIFDNILSNAEILSIYNNQNAGNDWDGGTRTCPSLPTLNVSKVSSVVSDPVNSITNPKRIPGTILKYIVTIENTAPVSLAEKVILSDDLSSEIITGNIIWNGNMSVTAPNINAGLATPLTDATGDDEGEFSGNNITVRCGDLVGLSSCVLEYLIEIN